MVQYSVLEKTFISYEVCYTFFLPLFLYLQSQIFPIMPCLVSKQHEHHILLGVLMDLSQPRLVTIQDKKTRERRQSSWLDKRKDMSVKKPKKTKKTTQIWDKKRGDEDIKRLKGKENLVWELTRTSLSIKSNNMNKEEGESESDYSI